jgi:hypothetical protein
MVETWGLLTAYQCASPFAAELVCEPGQAESANDSSCLEQAIGSRDEICGIGAGVELEVFDEGRLALIHQYIILAEPRSWGVCTTYQASFQ